MSDSRFDAAFARWSEASREELARLEATPECLAFSRLVALAGGGASASAEEQRHLDGCRRCRGWLERLRALEAGRARERDG